MRLEENMKYYVRKITDHFDNPKPKRQGSIVTFVMDPVIGKPAVLLYNSPNDHMGFCTSKVRDIRCMRTIMTGEMTMILETENSIYYLDRILEDDNGQTEGQ